MAEEKRLGYVEATAGGVRLDSSFEKKSKEVEDDEWVPHCVIPEHYFEFTLGGSAPRTSLSINTWDGREIMSVVRRH